MEDRGKLRCPECDFTSTRERRLAKHLRKSHHKLPLRCPLCVGVHYSGSTEELSAHKDQHHRSVRLRCFLCEFSSHRLARWLSHVTKVHNGEGVSLFVLASIYGKPKSSQTQGLTVSDDGISKDLQAEETKSCAEVPRVLSEQKLSLESQLNEPQSLGTDRAYSEARTPTSDSSVKFFCTRCEYSTSRSGKLTKHMERKHSDLSMSEKSKAGVESEAVENFCVKCPFCGSGFPTMTLLGIHCRSQHNLNSPPYHCSHCNYQSNFVSRLLTHMRRHTGEKPYACHICQYKAKLKAALREHLKIHSGVKLFKCHLCPHRCNRKPVLERHIRTHTGERPFACHLCTHRSADKSSLIKHVRVHTGEGRLACHWCSKKFSEKGYLATHIRTHTNERPYKCPICNYAAKQLQHLKTHLVTHTKEKQYICEICKRPFAHKSALNAHVKNQVCTKQLVRRLLDN